MRLGELLQNPALRKALAAGEARIGAMVGKLLADERFANALKSLLSSATHARRKVEKGVSSALHAANLPTRGDVSALERRLDELESTIGRFAARIGRDGRGS